MRPPLVLAALLLAGCTTPRLVVDASLGTDAGNAPDGQPDDAGLDAPPDEGPPDEGPPDEGAPDLFVCLGRGAGCSDPAQCCAPLGCGATSSGTLCCETALRAPCSSGIDCCNALDCQQHNGSGDFHCCHWWNDTTDNSCSIDEDCCGGHTCLGGQCQ